MAAEDVGGNVCLQTASWTNTGCSPPPDYVNLTWRIQNIVRIEDVQQARAARSQCGQS